ncbi:serine/threonine protein kinase [Blastomyces percursus]|uniref:non-specific serine/threonine protein kinase n=1 Tax=Blastomyces percursus TaxID=1658174 RepID=A0A1J9QKD1_9EURO|nr:serine/threonine protein kinase [Blastomyces percursus]
MADANLIACLYPYTEERKKTTKGKKKTTPAHKTVEKNKTENPSWLVPAQLQPEQWTDPGRQSRESTVPLDEGSDSEKEVPAYHYEDGLQLTFSHAFSHGLKGDKGFALGVHRDQSDIVLQDVKDGTISRCHCYLKFDDRNRLILQDRSSHGTVVTYDGKGGERRRKFKWILGGDEVPDEMIKEIVIEFHEDLKFQIVVPNHGAHPDQYRQYTDNVRRFRAEMAADDRLPLSRLGMNSARSTAAHSGAQSPSQDHILLKLRKLGQGSFATVTHLWDVSTGAQYACKKPRSRKFCLEAWVREIDTMRRIRHDHVVQLCRWDENPVPRLYLEYLAFGTLEDQHQEQPISYEETITILHQSLLALEYLHRPETAIVHRDIKPGNILVQTRDPLHIKLADFGLAKAGSSLNTVCGSPIYCPPEIAKYVESVPTKKYTTAVDIWSLGVVILEFAYGLPSLGADIGVRWCKKIVRTVSGYKQEDLAGFLSTVMLVMKPQLRRSACDYLDRVQELFTESQDGCLTPTPTSYSASYIQGYKTTSAGYYPEGNPTQEASLSSSDNAELNALPPDPHTPTTTETRKRSRRLLTSSSSSPTRKPSKRHAEKIYRTSSNDTGPLIPVVFGSGEDNGSNYLYDSLTPTARDTEVVSETGAPSGRTLYYDMVVGMLKDLQLKGVLSADDDNTTTSIDTICDEFCRLRITHITVKSVGLHEVTVNATCAGNHNEIVLSRLTSSGAIFSPLDLALSLVLSSGPSSRPSHAHESARMAAGNNRRQSLINHPIGPATLSIRDPAFQLAKEIVLADPDAIKIAAGSVSRTGKTTSARVEGAVTLDAASRGASTEHRTKTPAGAATYRGSWSMTIGPPNSVSDGSFNLDSASRRNKNLFIKWDRFTGTLESGMAEEQVCEAGQLDLESVRWDSVDKRVLEFLS